MDELHQQFGLIRDIPCWLSELKSDRGEGLRLEEPILTSEMTSLDWLEEKSEEDKKPASRDQMSDI